MNPSANSLALIVEDDPQIRNLMGHMLSSEDFEFSAVSNCSDAKQIVKSEKPNLVLLDLGLPGGDGLELGKWIRATEPSTGIIIVTGRSDVSHRVSGLKSCADDYVTKPFNVEEMRARIRNLMRRLGDRVSSLQKPRNALSVDGWFLQEDDCALTSGGREVKLTAMEFRLLKELAARPGKVATRGWLLDQLKADVDISERTVDYHVCTLRIKLRRAGLRNDVITSVRGLGYKYKALPGSSANGIRAS